MEALKKKLGITNTSILRCMHVPNHILDAWIDAGFPISNKKADIITHLFFFFTQQHELLKQIEDLVNSLQSDTKLFLCFPKGTSGIKTDMSRDHGWECVTENPKLRWVKLIAIDEQWSAFTVRLKTEKEKQSIKGLMKEYHRNEDYFDAVKKEVYPPDFFLQRLKKNKEAYSFFQSLAYSHQREYVGYIIGAKKEETQHSRADKVVQRLIDKKKNLTV